MENFGSTDERMQRRSFKSMIPLIRQVLWNLFLISLGSVICAIGINGILIPHQLLGAGFTGITLIIHYFIPSLPVSLIYFVLNIPLFGLGWKYVGRRFFLYSIAGLCIFSTALTWTSLPLAINDKILSALLAGIILGGGSGIILRSLGSAGGLDILCVILMKRFSIRLGTTILAFNSVILSIGAVFFSLEAALYTLIYIYVNSYMVNLVVTGLSQRKAVFVVSPHWKEISNEMIDKLHSGVTIIKARGGYTDQEIHVLYTVIPFQEISRLKSLVRDIDPDVFVVISDTLEVMGQRIGNQPNW